MLLLVIFLVIVCGILFYMNYLSGEVEKSQEKVIEIQDEIIKGHKTIIHLYQQQEDVYKSHIKSQDIAIKEIADISRKLISFVKEDDDVR